MAVASEATSPAASAATSSELRPTLNTASSNGTVEGRAARAWFVEVDEDGHHTTTLRSSGVEIRTARPPAAVVMPPSIDAAALSGCPSSSQAMPSAMGFASASGRPACSSPMSAPATRADPEKPRPRPGGIGLFHHSGPLPPARANATDAGWVGSASSALPPGEFDRRNGRSSARPSASKPGPRLADDAGTLTRIRPPYEQLTLPDTTRLAAGPQRRALRSPGRTVDCRRSRCEPTGATGAPTR